MPRIYSNYTTQEFETIKVESEKIGMSLSSYQKYQTLLGLSKNNTINISNLIANMQNELSKKRKNDVFIVSSLLPNEWVNLNRSQKNTLSQTLKKIVKNNPHRYSINQVLPGKINQYIVIE